MALGHVFATAFLVIGAGVAGVAFGFAVRYPTDRPESAEVDSIGSLWGPTIVLAALAVAFLAVAAGLWSGAIPL